MWEYWNPCSLLMEMLNDVATLKNSLCVSLYVHRLVVWLFETPWTVACQASLSMGFSRREFWSVLPFPPPGDLPNPGVEPESFTSPALAGRFFMSSGTWDALKNSLAVLKNITHTMIIWPIKYMNTSYISIIHNRWKVETALMSTNGWMAELKWFVHTMECYSAMKRNNILIQFTTWMKLENSL